MKRSLCIVLSIVLGLSVLGCFARRIYAGDDSTVCIKDISVLQTISGTGTSSDDDSPLDASDSEDLFAGYVDQVFASYSSKAGEPSRGSIHSDLDGPVNNAIYNALKTQIEKVAAGEITSTEFSIDSASVGIDSSVYYTAADLGVSSLFDQNGYLSEETETALQKKAGFSLGQIFTALLNNCPYDLYWFDKTYGYYYSMYGYTGDRSSVFFWNTMSFGFYAAEEYKAGDDYFTVDSSTGQAVQHAAAKAASIVAANKDLPDYEKLVAYKDAICDLTSYNHTAVDENWDYGNPWQLIWVFDEVESTKVVCEGYSKAFQYLCQLSSFSSSMIESRIVSGWMSGGTGGGGHMWNVVSMDDGRNYLVDITNCDSGTIGNPDLLFFKGAIGSVTGGYTINCYGTDIWFDYDDDTLDLYSTSVLTLSGTDYEPPQVENIVPTYSATVTMNENFNLNLYVKDLPQQFASAFTVKWTFDGKNYEKNLGELSPQTGGQYPGSFKVTLATVFSYEMTKPFVIQVYRQGTEAPIKEINYSVQTYFVNQYNKTSDALFKQIYGAALDYGASAQLYFNGQTNPTTGQPYDTDAGNLANKTTNPSFTISATKPTNKASKSGSITGMGDSMTATLIFGSETSIKIYFTYSGNINNMTITADNGKTVTAPEQGSDGRYSVKIEGIRSFELYKDYTITFKVGTQTRTVTYSAYAYAASKWDSSNADLARLVKALVAYGELARQKWQ